MSSGSIRIIQLTEKSSVNTDDYMAVDSSTNGTKKIKFTDLLDNNLSTQNKAADAQATGEAINDVNARVDNLIDCQNESVTNLWTGSLYTKNASVTLSDSISNYDFIDVYLSGYSMEYTRRPVSSTMNITINCQNMIDTVSQAIHWYEVGITLSGTTATLTRTIACDWNDFANVPVVAESVGEAMVITRIDGIKKAQTSNSEIVDARVGADGVTYNSLGTAIRTQVSDLKSDFDSVFVTTKGKNLFDKSAVLENKYCNVNGAISDYNGRYVTDYIPVEAGKIVTSSYLNSATQVQTQATYSSLCCYDSTKAVVSGGNINQQTFTVPNGVAFVRITFASNMYVYNGMVELTDDGVPTVYEPYTEDSVSLAEDITIQMGQVIGLESRLTTDESNITSIKNDLDGILDTDIIFDQSGFIRYDGVLIANGAYISTDYVDITVNGTFVKYKYRLRMFANTKIAYYDDSKVFISAISPSESSTLEYVEGEVPYVDGAKYVRFCTAIGITDYYVKYATVKNAVIGGANDSNPCNYTGNDMSVFNKVLCIGDSLTSGTFNYRVGGTTGNYIEDAKYSYPTYLKKLTGCDTVNMGNGGLSSAEWYNTHQNDDLSGYDCAVIQLGVNDCIRYTTWGSTSETAFTNIISKLKAENKNIKIFVANIIPATSYSNAQYLAFSADLLTWVQSTYASDSSVIPLDMQQYGHTKDSPAYNCGHLSALGYWRLAQDYKGYIGWYMNQNKTVFKEVQFIGTDYYYDPIA